MNLFKELKRRNVFKVGVAYVDRMRPLVPKAAVVKSSEAILNPSVGHVAESLALAYSRAGNQERFDEAMQRVEEAH